MTTEDLLVALLKTFLKDITEHLDRIEQSVSDLKALHHGTRMDMFTKVTDVNKQVGALDARRKSKLPRECLVYVCDHLEDGTPIYAVAHNVEDIPEDQHGALIGNYVLNRVHKFRLKRELV